MKTLAIAGATGFIGRWFIEQYREKYKIIALTRRKMKPTADSQVEWRQVELYSIRSTTQALAGADYALYLVHSMNPSTRLNQGTFDDTDLLLADNFARAAATNQLEHILYVGGILPKEDKTALSAHLRSRWEVEQTLAGRGTPLTTLRAGLIIGPGGSSFRIVEKLVQRLPIMACPAWTLSESQPISLRDTLQLIDACLGHRPVYHKALEIGGDDVLRYMDLLRLTAKKMGKKRRIFAWKWIPARLSKHWVGYFSGASTKFAAPLVESLQHTMTVNPEHRAQMPKIDYQPIEQAIEEALTRKAAVPKLPPQEAQTPEKNTVRSHQRLPNPKQYSAQIIADAYQRWLPRFLRYLIRAKSCPETHKIAFYLFFWPKAILELQRVPTQSARDRQLFYITGGLLVKRKDYGWLEFRSILDGRYVIAAIHEFVPRLPWFIYIHTQARAHLWVMRRFAHFLQQKAPKTK